VGEELTQVGERHEVVERRLGCEAFEARPPRRPLGGERAHASAAAAGGEALVDGADETRCRLAQRGGVAGRMRLLCHGRRHEPAAVPSAPDEPREEIGHDADRATRASPGEVPTKEELARARVAAAEAAEERRLDDRLDVRPRLVLVEHDGLGVDARLERVLAEDARAEGMDRGYLRTEELALDARPVRP